MTLGECFGKILKLLNYAPAGGMYASGGLGTDGSDPVRTELFLRAVSLIDAAQIEVTSACPILRTAEIVCTRQENRIATVGIHRVGAGGLTFALPDADARALSLRTQDALTVRVLQERDGETVTLAEVRTEDAPALQAYTAVWTPGEGPIRLHITGTGHVTDPALYRESFPDAASVPVFGRWRDRPLPADFRSLVRLTLRPRLGPAVPDCRDYRLRDGHLALPWTFEGDAELTYAAYPAPVTEETGLDEPLTVDGAAAEAVVCSAAAGLTAGEDAALEKRLLARYRALLSASGPARTAHGIAPSLYAAPRRRFA